MSEAHAELTKPALKPGETGQKRPQPSSAGPLPAVGDAPAAPPLAGAVEGKSTVQPTGEHGGPKGPEPTRYGDWEKGGRCFDF